MSGISSLGNQIYLNQNTPALSSKTLQAHGRVIAQEMINMNSFEENNKRQKDTRETEENGSIEEHLSDNEVYSVYPKYKNKKHNNKQSEDLFDNLVNKKLDLKV